MIGPVGDDFGDDEYAVLRARGVITDDIEHVAGGKTFFWAGRYERDVNLRHTLQTDLNVFETSSPSSPTPRAPPTTLFLANIQPDLQRAVREQCDARALHGAGLDEPVDRHRPRLAACARSRWSTACSSTTPRSAQLTDEPNLVRAAAQAARHGPARGGRQAGRVRRGACSRATASSALPAYPTPDVVDPTGAGDTLRGRLHGLRRRARRRGARRRAAAHARWPTAPRWRPSTSRRSAPSGCRRSRATRSPPASTELQRISAFEPAPLELRA